jgi:hypothetical protein
MKHAVKELVREAKAAGWQVEPTRRHWRLLYPNGAIIVVSSTGIVKLTNLTLNPPPEEVCQRRRSSGKFFT